MDENIMKKLIFIALAACCWFSLLSLPPAPGAGEFYRSLPEFPSEIYDHKNNARSLQLPQNILTLMVDFSDVTFNLTPVFPDSLPHDIAYYERLLFHMSCYWQDASNGNYVLTEENYTVWEEVITLPNTMAYYGNDDLQLTRVCEMVLETIQAVDDDIDFSLFDAIIIIHAGAGQETDTNMTDQIYSTFLSRRSLQAGLDPQNDNYPGIETNDGVFLKEFSIIPETENQPYLQPGDQTYGMMGVINHNFGHQIGLPTLFDNVDSNGVSYGIGGYGVMGTGVWNANGYVTPLPCAWSRYYLGWTDQLVEMDFSEENLLITFPMAKDDITPKMYKLKISESEYFLVENRQQNPDGSWYVNAAGDTVVSFTFALTDEQSVYPPGNLNAGQPRFDFMKNSYLGCEWDFYLPGYGFSADPSADGSGILIWHIDENVINANFDPGFEMNQVNADALHKGVDLEQASGIQTLDSPQFGLESFYGSPNDAFRKKYFINQSGMIDSLNYYFGFDYYNNVSWFPTSESYYGGIPLEIDNISVSDSLMSFSVRYGWSLSADYSGSNHLSLLEIDFDLDGSNELMQPLPNGNIFLWQNDLIFPDFPLTFLSNLSIPYQLSYDKNSNSVLMAGQINEPALIILYRINYNLAEYRELVFHTVNSLLTGPVVINPDETSAFRAFLPFNSLDNSGGKIVVFDNSYQQIDSFELNTDIHSNIILEGDCIHFIGSNSKIYSLNFETGATGSVAVEIDNFPQQILSFQMTDLDGDDVGDFIFTTADSLLYIAQKNGILFSSFPVEIPLDGFSLPSFADLTRNGKVEILIGGENRFLAFDILGNSYSPSRELVNPDSTTISAGVVAADIMGNGQLQIIGSFSRNRLTAWQMINQNDFTSLRNYPQTFRQRSRSYPVFASYSSVSPHIYLSCDNGIILRADIPSGKIPESSGSIYEYANLQRTGYWQKQTYPLPDISSVFRRDETYFYPNPLSSTFSRALDFSNPVPDHTIILKVMTSIDTKVEVKIFDIVANEIFEKKQYCEKDFAQKIYIDAGKLASGVYLAVIKADGETLRLKFAIQK